MQQLELSQRTQELNKDGLIESKEDVGPNGNVCKIITEVKSLEVTFVAVFTDTT